MVTIFHFRQTKIQTINALYAELEDFTEFMANNCLWAESNRTEKW